MWVDDGPLRKMFFFSTKAINNSKGSVLIHYSKRWGRGCSEDFRGSHGFKGERRGISSRQQNFKGGL